MQAIDYKTDAVHTSDCNASHAGWEGQVGHSWWNPENTNPKRKRGERGHHIDASRHHKPLSTRLRFGLVFVLAGRYHPSGEEPYLKPAPDVPIRSSMAVLTPLDNEVRLTLDP